ncbi:MAG: hypothetical protein L0Y56_05515 [Nitrospira sp.]|nr:hypothetical protein [Nitrospira sp.]
MGQKKKTATTAASRAMKFATENGVRFSVMAWVLRGDNAREKYRRLRNDTGDREKSFARAVR